MSKSRINACSACAFRHDPISNPKQVKKCCFETCASFHGMTENIENTKCGQACLTCVNAQIPRDWVFNSPINNEFKNCLYDSPTEDKALGCCLGKCKDFKCQEQCIDGYNALQTNLTKESFQ